MDGNGIFWSGETASSRVAGDLAGSDIERSLGTNKETVATDHGVGGDGRTLWKREYRMAGQTRVQYRWMVEELQSRVRQVRECKVMSDTP